MGMILPERLEMKVGSLWRGWDKGHVQVCPTSCWPLGGIEWIRRLRVVLHPLSMLSSIPFHATPLWCCLAMAGPLFLQLLEVF